MFASKKTSIISEVVWSGEDEDEASGSESDEDEELSEAEIEELEKTLIDGRGRSLSVADATKLAQSFKHMKHNGTRIGERAFF